MAFWNNQTNCPVCETQLSKAIEHAPNHTEKFGLVCCPVCGVFVLHEDAYSFLDVLQLPNNNKVAIYSHAIRKQELAQKRADPPVITRELFDYWWNNATLPSPSEQADNLIQLLGDNQTDPGKGFWVDPISDAAIVGSFSHYTFQFVANSLVAEGIIEPLRDNRTLDELGLDLMLSFDGWKRYEDLKRGTESGNTTFMAMQFGDNTLERIVDHCFRPAVTETGFELRKINDPQSQRAGLIDDRLRVEIKAARFMICDLTHNNNGAYWEAGYAEGLGKPVIYTCERNEFELRSKAGGGTHFDTNHHLHILWDDNDLEKVAEELKACIRTTIPEANQND